MIIRKKYKAESAHIVRNCHSKRCKFSIHGHSSIIEVFFSSNKLDNAGMIVDFGVLSGAVKDFIDSFDHAYILWDKESEEFKKFINNNSDRVIEMNVSPSAENLSLVMLSVISMIINMYDWSNGEGDVEVVKVRYHETATGYAEAELSDLDMLTDILDITFSKSIKEEWSTDWLSDIQQLKKITLPKPLQQCNL